MNNHDLFFSHAIQQSELYISKDSVSSTLLPLLTLDGLHSYSLLDTSTLLETMLSPLARVERERESRLERELLFYIPVERGERRHSY
jgi:hypothetical protein